MLEIKEGLYEKRLVWWQVAALLAGSRAVVQPGEELSQLEKNCLEGDNIYLWLRIRIQSLLPDPDIFHRIRILSPDKKIPKTVPHFFCDFVQVYCSEIVNKRIKIRVAGKLSGTGNKNLNIEKRIVGSRF